MGEPPILPKIILPEPVALPPRMELLAPSFYTPKYTPVVLPSARQMKKAKLRAQEKEEAQAKTRKTQPAPQPTPQVVGLPETTTISVPFISTPLPVPKPEILSTAVFTAGAASVTSVAGTLAAGALFKQLTKVLKPVMTTTLKKIATARGKTPVESDARRRWRQRGCTRHSGRNQV